MASSDLSFLYLLFLLFIMSQDRTPASFLSEIVGKPVIVRLNSGIDYRGKYIT
jgi:hypothetical protein